MMKKIKIHSSSLETLLHTKVHLSQQTLTISGANTMLWLNGSLGRSLWSPYHSFPRIIRLLVHFMPRNMIFLTQQDPKDSSELSNNPGFTKLEHQLDINIVFKSEQITIML